VTATVVVAPAMGVRAGYYTRLCEGLSGFGLRAAAVDYPGIGQSPVRADWGHDWGYGELVTHYASALRALELDRPRLPRYVLGHSLGGQAALMLAGRPDSGLAGVILVASGSPWWRSWPGLEGWRVRASTRVCELIARGLGYFPGERVGFGGREARTLVKQWARVSRTGNYRLDGFDGDALLRAPGPPTLAIEVVGDRLAPEAAIRRTLDRVRSRELRYERWEGAPHGGDHNRWPSGPQPVVERVARFVADVQQGQGSRESDA
jgi:predicted alpha/beta hydrolase